MKELNMIHYPYLYCIIAVIFILGIAILISKVAFKMKFALVFLIVTVFISALACYRLVSELKQSQVSLQTPDLSKRIPIDTRYLIVEASACPADYYAVVKEGARLDFLIPAGTLVIGSGEPGVKKYLLCGKVGERPRLLPPVR